MLLKFKEFLDNSWNGTEFCHMLAMNAELKVLSEMAMAGGEAPKMAILYDQDDWKFLSQFPPQIWKQALSWRYNEGIRMLMRLQKNPTDIPEGYDWIDSVSLPAPGGRDKWWVFGQPDGPKNFYIGLTKLAHKLTDKPKIEPGDTGDNYPHWPKEHGPSLKELDPHQGDKEHPQHLSKYKHGLYNFDLSGMVEVTPEDIDDMTDYQMVPLLPKKKFKRMNLKDPNVLKSAPVQAEIKKIKTAMKKELKHTFAGYDVLQPSKAQESLMNWIKANASEERLFGEHPTIINDKWDNNQPKNVQYVRGDQIFQGKSGGGLGHMQIPTIQRKINFTEVDEKKKTQKGMSVDAHIPVLNPVKTIPALHKLPPDLAFSDQQKAMLASRSTYEDKDGHRYPYQWNPAEETFEQAKKRYQGKGNFELAASPEDLEKVLANWDILTPKQREWLKDHTKTLHHQAQVYHTQGDVGDPHANPKNKSFYMAGFSPNYKTQERWSFSVPADLQPAFVEAYKGKMIGEVLGSAQKGKIGEEQKSLIDYYIDDLAEKGVSQQSIQALKDRSHEIAKFIAYMLLTWLDNPKYGIKDDKFGLLRHVDWSDYDEEINKRNRRALVRNYLASLAQQATADTLSRRQQKKFGASSIKSLDIPIGDTGKTLAGQVTKEQKPQAIKIDTSAVRRWLHRGLGAVATAAHKPHQMFANVDTFLAAKRSYVVHVLRGAAGQIEKDMKFAEDSIITAMEESQTLYEKYNELLKAQYPNETDREAKIKELLQKELPGILQAKHPEKFGTTPEITKSPEFENIMVTAINNAMAMSKTPTQHKGAMGRKIDDAMQHFFNELIDKWEARKPVWDSAKEDFEDGAEVVLDKFPSSPSELIKIVKALYTADFTFLANIWLRKRGVELYKSVLAAKEEDEGKDEAQIATEFEDALRKEATAAPPTSKPAQATVTPMPQKPQVAPQPAVAAAKPVDELLRTAGSFKTGQEGIALMKAILAKEAEFGADKDAANKLYQADNEIHSRWSQLSGAAPLELRQEFMRTHKLLKALISRLS